MERLAHTITGIRRPVGWLVVAAACWGVDTTLSEYALRQLRPADVLLVQTVVGAAGLWLLLLASGSYQRVASTRPYLGLGLIEPGAAYLLLDLGLRRTNAVSGGILLSTETLLAIAICVIVLREAFRLRTAVALVAGVAGTILVVAGGSHGTQVLRGDLLVLAGAAAAASYYLVAPGLPVGDHVLTGTAYQLLASVAVAVAFAAWTWSTKGSLLLAASAGHLSAAGATGIIGISIPFFLLNRSLTSTSASTAALVLNLVPVFSVISAMLLLGERLSLLAAAGGAVIIGGLLILLGSTVRDLLAPTPVDGGPPRVGEVR